MGSDPLLTLLLLPFHCFNPRSRMGSDISVQFIADQRCMVSTHAPAWGATEGNDYIFKVNIVSTHAPAWGATFTLETIIKVLSFNPRSRMGSDGSKRICRDKQKVSTHAPAWGATWALSELAVILPFQPTLPHGERLSPSIFLIFN